jgi:hypothetical protein
MQQSFPGISPSISEWKGQDIVNFQEELLHKVNAHVSEKWFYTHMKSEKETLPRIDVLNLLSKYAGYADWNDFIFKNSGKSAKTRVRKESRYFIIVPAVGVVILSIFLLLNKLISNREYTFCFYDAVTKDPVSNISTNNNTNNNINNSELIEVSVIMKDESPVNYLCGPNGCLTLRTNQSVIRMVVNSPYYRNDTITRILKKFNREETIGLRPNEYALMLRYFSEMNVDDWQKRRIKLEEMFDDGAMIYQVMNDKHGTGMELYNKEEFIDKLTMPSHSLKNIEILGTKYIGEKIAVLRFRTNEREP